MIEMLHVCDTKNTRERRSRPRGATVACETQAARRVCRTRLGVRRDLRERERGYSQQSECGSPPPAARAPRSARGACCHGAVAPTPV